MMKSKNGVVKIILCMFPVSVIFLIQLGLSYVLPVILRLAASISGQDGAAEVIDSGSILYFFIYELICMFLVMAWYYLAYGRKKDAPAGNRFYRVKSIPVVFLLAGGIYFLVAVYLDLAAFVMPRKMSQYGQMIESSGLAGLTVLSTIITLCIAPVFEELLFRGLMLKTAALVKLPFWAANLLQAFVFGLFHMDLIQGIYAFCLGLVLGGFFKWYGVLAAPVFLHGVFNFFGTYVAGSIRFLPEGWAGDFIMLAVGLALILLSETLRKKDRNPSIE